MGPGTRRCRLRRPTRQSSVSLHPSPRSRRHLQLRVWGQHFCSGPLCSRAVTLSLPFTAPPPPHNQPPQRTQFSTFPLKTSLFSISHVYALTFLT